MEIFSVYNEPAAESKSSDSLAQKENTSSENSPGHGNAQNLKIRARDIVGKRGFFL